MMVLVVLARLLPRRVKVEVESKAAVAAWA